MNALNWCTSFPPWHRVQQTSPRTAVPRTWEKPSVEFLDETCNIWVVRHVIYGSMLASRLKRRYRACVALDKLGLSRAELYNVLHRGCAHNKSRLRITSPANVLRSEYKGGLTAMGKRRQGQNHCFMRYLRLRH